MPNRDDDIIRAVLDLQEIDSYHKTDVRVYFRADLDFRTVKFTWTNPVPIRDSDGKLLGFAALDAERTGLFAHIFITKDCPERLDLEENTRPMYLLAGDTCTVFYDTDTGPVQAREIIVRSLRLESELSQLSIPVEPIQ